MKKICWFPFLIWISLGQSQAKDDALLPPLRFDPEISWEGDKVAEIRLGSYVYPPWQPTFDHLMEVVVRPGERRDTLELRVNETLLFRFLKPVHGGVVMFMNTPQISHYRSWLSRTFLVDEGLLQRLDKYDLRRPTDYQAIQGLLAPLDLDQALPRLPGSWTREEALTERPYLLSTISLNLLLAKIWQAQEKRMTAGVIGGKFFSYNPALSHRRFSIRDHGAREELLSLQQQARQLTEFLPENLPTDWTLDQRDSLHYDRLLSLYVLAQHLHFPATKADWVEFDRFGYQEAMRVARRNMPPVMQASTTSVSSDSLLWIIGLFCLGGIVILGRSLLKKPDFSPKQKPAAAAPTPQNRPFPKAENKPMAVNKPLVVEKEEKPAKPEIPVPRQEGWREKLALWLPEEAVEKLSLEECIQKLHFKFSIQQGKLEEEQKLRQALNEATDNETRLQLLAQRYKSPHWDLRELAAAAPASPPPVVPPTLKSLPSPELPAASQHDAFMEEIHQLRMFLANQEKWGTPPAIMENAWQQRLDSLQAQFCAHESYAGIYQPLILRFFRPLLQKDLNSLFISSLTEKVLEFQRKHRNWRSGQLKADQQAELVHYLICMGLWVYDLVLYQEVGPQQPINPHEPGIALVLGPEKNPEQLVSDNLKRFTGDYKDSKLAAAIWELAKTYGLTEVNALAEGYYIPRSMLNQQDQVKLS